MENADEFVREHGNECWAKLAPAKRGSAIGVSEARMVFANLRMAGLGDGVLARLVGDGYLDAPASKGHHLDVPGGLALHSLKVTDALADLGDALGVAWPRAESPYLVGMLHDLVKTRCYAPARPAEDGPCAWRYVQPAEPGHGVASLLLATVEYGIRLLPEEAAAVAYHMGPWGVGREYSQAEYDAALERFPRELIAAHTADWWASKVLERGLGAKPCATGACPVPPCFDDGFASVSGEGGGRC